eukprot:Plantae.Rhodophyta-Hildenbrandia_rubra.ctg4899.p1 GENE.Plantae.Rhodophyta-Hildenbrandia_rubra.ctg4899~~Plantae.Rhodophyta-Hildenbrandia_rubra.ctg4899.p1  ORF type:complete len:635 (-),score=129.55 Plantae.Rhodophyta-Hildenbrandia_rubra.ctg4899:1772-3676(-)
MRLGEGREVLDALRGVGVDERLIVESNGAEVVAVKDDKEEGAFEVGDKLGERIERSWAKKGYGGALKRTFEIWLFFGRFVWGELKVRKLEDPQEQARKRTEIASRLKKGLLYLGPTFIKLGQLLSTRVDVLPKEYISELTSLQDRVPGFSGKEAMRLIEADLGKPVYDLFDEFEMEPLAAASLGQVHRGKIDGKSVVIKIQRSGLKDLFDVDLKNLKVLAKLLDKFDPKNDGAQRNWVSIYEESAKMLYQEIDYNQEGRNADLFRRNFMSTPWVKVPFVYWSRTSSRVLTMEYCPGIKINDLNALEANGIDTRLLARRSAESYLTQLLRHGFFHCDPHPGNLAADSVEGGRLIYYDFGMMSSIDPSIKSGLTDAIFGIYEGSERDICDAMVKMGILSSAADRLTVEKIGRYFLGLFRTNISDGNRSKTKEEKRVEMGRRLNSIGEDLLAVGDDEPFRFPAVFTFVFRAFTTLEGIGKGLDPKYDLTLLAAPYLKEIIDLRDGSLALSTVKNFQKKVGWRRQDIEAVVTQPRKTAYIEKTLKRMEAGDLRLRVRVLESERSFKRMSLMQENMGMAIIAAMLTNAACVLSTSAEKYATQARIVWLMALIVACRLAVGVLKLKALDQRMQKFTANRS